MSFTGFLQGLGVISKSRTRETTKPSYGVIRHGRGSTTIYAPSGEEALRIAGTDGVSIQGEKYVACNHQGGGVYVVTTEEW